jgi:hypothetical protein
MTDSAYIKRQFFDSLKRGTGEAYFILRDNPNIDFSDLIIKGATINYAYDRQCEDSRAFYINSLIKKSKQKDKIINSVLKELQKQKDDFYNLDQMCDLALYFYKSGRQEAAEALRKRFDKNSNKNYQFCGQGQLMEIDGLSGLLKVAETIGEILYNDKDDSERCWRVDNFQKKNKSIDVYAELKKAGKKNKYIKAYLKSILADKKNNNVKVKVKKIVRFTYEHVKKYMDGKPSLQRFLNTSVNKDLTEAEVLKLANEFTAEKDKKRQELYLRFFSTRKYPLDIAPIFKIAKGKNPKKTRLVEFAVEALQHFKSKEIREFAIDKITNSKDPSDYLKLLVSNYKKGDYKLLSSIANKSDEYEYIHSLVFGFIAIYQANSTKECKQPLEIIYNKMNCGLHRIDIVNLLGKNGVLSDKIFNELKFDSYDEVRKLYKQKKNGI